MPDAATRLWMLNRDWDRINHAHQKERDALQTAAPAGDGAERVHEGFPGIISNPLTPLEGGE